MNKDGKFIFGNSLIREDITIHLPTQAITEYNIVAEAKIYLFTESKSTGGFCVTRKRMSAPPLREKPKLLTAKSKYIRMDYK